MPLLVTDSGPVVAQAAGRRLRGAADRGRPRRRRRADPAPEPPPVQRGLAQAAVDAAEAAGVVGRRSWRVAVFDRATGELAVGERGHERFYTASLAKLVVIVDVLDRRRTEGLQVTDADLAAASRGRSGRATTAR